MNVKYSKIDCSHLPYVVLFSATLVICIAPPLSCQERAASEDVVVQRIASAYYAKKYGVDLKEAERRLTIQDRAAGIDDAIAKLLGDQFAGIWYDHADRGTLKIGMTAAAMKHADEVRRLAISHGVAADMDLVTVAFTLAELEQKQDLIRSDIEDMIDAGHASTSYDTKLNNVVVTALAKLPSGEETRVKNLAEMSGVTVRRIDVPTLIGKLDACTVKGCDPPLRGGVVIRQDGGNQAGESNTFATCTAGFIARDRTNPNSLWVITGGHCIFLRAALGRQARNHRNAGA